MSEDSQMPEERMRLDVFIWRARFFKTRTASTEAIERKGARIERDGLVRRIDKPATHVEPGDILSFKSPAGPQLLRILALPDRRGPPAEASACYETLGEQASARPKA